MDEGDLSIPFPGGVGDRALTVVVEAGVGRQAGLNGPVTIEGRGPARK